MSIKFNTLLREAGFPLCDVRLLRHQDRRPDRLHTPYYLWRYKPRVFERYQETQDFDNETKLAAPYWAEFVGTEDHKTLFIGIYAVHCRGSLEQDRPAPNRKTGAIEKAGSCNAYDLTLKRERSALGDLIGRLYIDWSEGRGKGRGGEKAWVQYAETHDKPVTEMLLKPVSRPGLRSAHKHSAKTALVKPRH